MKNRLSLILSMWVMVFSLFSVQGQAHGANHYVLGINLTGTGYYGDVNFAEGGLLSKSMKYFNVSPGLHLSLLNEKKQIIQRALNGGYGRIIAQNPDLTPIVFGPGKEGVYTPPRYVRTDFLYADANVVVRPLIHQDFVLQPYAQAGLGGFLFFPRKNDTIAPKGVDAVRAEKFSTVTLSMPVTVGTTIKVSNDINMNVATMYRLPFTDYLDWFGAKNVPNLNKGFDQLYSFVLGTNFNMFKSPKMQTPARNEDDPVKPTKPNKANPYKDQLPIDSTFFASTENNWIQYLQPNPVYKGVKKTPTNYPDGWVPLTVLAKSIDCDSLARLSDQRISILYTENTQLRSQYKKIETQLNETPTQVADASLQPRIDSLIRVVYQKESEVEKLKGIIGKTDNPTVSVGASEKMAELQKENIALKEEIATLQAGKTSDPNSVGYAELQDKYNKLSEANQKLDTDYQAAMSLNTQMREELARRNPNDGNQNEVLLQRIDSLMAVNKEVLMQSELMKKNYIELQGQLSDVSARNKDLESQLKNSPLNEVLTQVEQMNAKVAQLEEQAAQDAANIRRLQAELDMAKENSNPATLIQGMQARIDSVNLRYTTLQSTIDSYELLLKKSANEKDSLANIVAALQAKVNEVGDVRMTSLEQELKETRDQMQLAQLEAKQAKEDLTEANTVIAEMKANANNTPSDVNGQELALALERIKKLEQENEALKNNGTGAVVQADSTVEGDVLTQKMQQLAFEKEEAETKALEWQNKYNILAKSTNADYINNLQSQLDESKLEVNNLKAQYDNLKNKTVTPPGLMGNGDSIKIAQLNTEIEELRAVNTKLNEKNLELMEVVNNTNPNPTAPNPALAILKKENEELKAENTSLLDDRDRLQKELERVGDPGLSQELAVQVRILDMENSQLRVQLQRYATLAADLADANDKIGQLQAQIDEKNAIIASRPENANLQVDEMKEQLVQKETELNGVQQQLQIAVNKNKELSAQAQQLQLDKNDLEAVITDLKAKPSSPDNPELLAEKDAQIQALTAQVSKLQTELENTTPGDNTAILTAKTREIDSLNAVIATYAARVPQPQGGSDDIIAAQKQTIDSLNTVIATYAARVPQPQGGGDDIIAAQKQTIDSLQSVIVSLKAATPASGDDKEGIIAAQQVQIQALQEQNLVLAKRYEDKVNASHPDGNEPSADLIASLNNEINGLNTKLKEADEQNASLTANISSLTAELQVIKANGGAGVDPELVAKLSLLEKQNNDVNTVNKQLVGELENCKATNDPAMAEKLEKAELEIEELNRKIAQGTSSGTQEQISALNIELKKMELDRDEWKQKYVDVMDNPLNKPDTEPLIAQINALKAERDDWKQKYEALATNPANPDAGALAAMTTERDDWKQKYEALAANPANPDAGALAAMTTERDDWKQKYEALAANPANPDAGALAAMTTERDDWKQKYEALAANPANPDAGALAAMTVDRDNWKTQFESFKNQNFELIDQLQEQKEDNQAMREQLELINTGETAAALTAANVSIDELKADKRKKDDQIDALQREIAHLHEVGASPEVATLKQANATLTEQLTAANAEIVMLKAKPQTPIEPATPGQPFDKEAELLAVKKQNEEIFIENENIRSALANALIALQNRPEASAETNPELDLLKTTNAQLAKDLNEANQKIAMLSSESGVPVTENPYKVELETVTNINKNLLAQNAIMKKSNDSLVQQLSIQTYSTAEAQMTALRNQVDDLQKRLDEKTKELNVLINDGSGTELIADLQAKNAVLEGQVITLNEQLRNQPAATPVEEAVAKVQNELKAERERANKLDQELIAMKSIDVKVMTEDLDKLRVENQTLRSTIEDNADYIGRIEREKATEAEKVSVLTKEVERLKSNTAPSVNPAVVNADAQRRIDSLNYVIVGLRSKELQTPVNTEGNVVLAEKEQVLNRRIAELEAREKRVIGRESFLEDKEEEFQLQIAKANYLKSKEIELQLLAQRLEGFPDYNAEVMQNGAPCFPVNPFIEKDDVMNRINTYFTQLGYKYEIEDGKMVYNNVLVPEVSKKPMNISFYMMTSKSGKKVFQGSYQFADNKAFVTSERFPAEAKRAMSLLQKLSQ